MTYLEKIIEELQNTVNRHIAAIERNCSDKVKQHLNKQYEGEQIRIKFIKYQPEEYYVSDYEYLLFEAPFVNIELKHDIQSIFYEFKLYEPEFFNSFSSAGVDCPGFIVRIPSGWTEQYKDKEYENSEDEQESMFYWYDYKCSEDNLNKRYKYFNSVIERYLK